MGTRWKGKHGTIRTMKVNSNLTKVLKKKHEEKWVALSADHSRVVDFDKDFIKLTNRMDKQTGRYVYMKVLRSDTEYCFSLTWQSD